MPAEHHCLHVLDGGAGLPGDERREAGRIEDAGHAEHALLWPAGDVLRHVAHRVERVGDDDQDRVRALRDRLLCNGSDDLLVRGDEVVSAHPRFAGNPRGGASRGKVVKLRGDKETLRQRFLGNAAAPRHRFAAKIPCAFSNGRINAFIEARQIDEPGERFLLMLDGDQRAIERHAADERLGAINWIEDPVEP